jgi:hypothetical protein
MAKAKESALREAFWANLSRITTELQMQLRYDHSSPRSR